MTNEVESVRYKGSSTQIHALIKWMDGEDYIEPTITTRDINMMDIETANGVVTVKPGQWIVRSKSGEFSVKEDIFSSD